MIDYILVLNILLKNLRNVDGKVQGSSKRATFCICGPKKSLRQDSERRAVILYEKIRNCRKVCTASTRYVAYVGSKTVVRYAVGTTESFKLKLGLHQRSALGPFLFAVIMDRLTDKTRREPL